MARSLQVLCLISRFGARSVSTQSYRFASRGVSKAWTGHSDIRRDRQSNRAPRYDAMSDGDFGLEEVEDKLKALVDEERKRQKTVRYNILRRQMTASGPPDRKLTWEAIEQIRYLKKELPEEWTVERLAEGFSVTPDVVLRVLRSKFNPSPDRKAKQDAKVVARLSLHGLPPGAGTEQSRPKLPGRQSVAALAAGSGEQGLVPVAVRTPIVRDKSSGLLVKSSTAVTALPSKLTAFTSNESTVMTSSPEATNSDPVEGREDEDSWDGQLLSEAELEGFFGMEYPPLPMQVGNEFFDAEGNFLYRI